MEEDFENVTGGNIIALQHRDQLFNEPYASGASTLVPGGFTASQPHQPTLEQAESFWRLQFRWPSTYRVLNGSVMIGNIIALITLLVKTGLKFSMARSITTASASNLAVATLIRQDAVVNLIFLIFGKCPRWMPLSLRRIFAKVFHLGGIHVGAVIAATMWFAVLNIILFNTPLRGDTEYLVGMIRIALIITDGCLFMIITVSIPYLRSRFHDFWELIHRYLGWMVVILFWALLFLLTTTSRTEKTMLTPFGLLLVYDPTFWLLLLTTFTLTVPWITLRKVPVRFERLSTHAIRLHFEYTNVPRSASVRLANYSLLEWHAFASIPAITTPGFSVLVSRAGDWTADIIDNPPTYLWKKGIPVRGVIHMAQIFRKVVLVATGSGIGPILSLLIGQRLNIRILWSTLDPISTFGQAIVRQVRDADPNAVIINTTERGRPDLVRETYDLYTASNAEAVFVISNYNTTRRVVSGLEARKVPVFAPIFDS